MDKLLSYVYFDLHNYVGAKALYEIAKEYNKELKLKDVKEWLNKQEVHQQTTAKDVAIKRFYKPIFSDSPYAFQIDLTFLPMYKKQNDGYYVLFTGININSRYAYAYWAKDKESKAIIRMLNQFKDNALEIDTITSDSGSEFTSKAATEWFNDNEIKTFFFVGDSNKLGIINRFHRTLKDKLNKYMIANDSVRWIDIIDKIVYNYNRTVNRGIGFTPLQASKPIVQSTIINKALLKTKLFEEFIEEDFRVGERCRIILDKKLFDKGSKKYSQEIYTVVKVNKNTLDLEDEEGEVKKGVKKDDVVFIKEVEKRLKNENIKEAVKENKVERKLKQVGIDPKNEVREKRTVRKPSRYND